MSSSPEAPRHVMLDTRVLQMLKEKIGHEIPERRHAQVKETVASLATESGYTSVDEYLALARTLPMDAPLVQSLVHAITNKESYFFRDAPTVQSLRDHILPDVISRASGSKTLRIWSAGCSTGEELYTLSILLQEKIHDYDAWRICLLGTDIDEVAVQKARRGIYKPWSLRTTSDNDRRRYFHVDSQNNLFTLKNQYRMNVAFGLHNLADANQEVPSPGLFDLIFCRNVLIYFDEPATRLVHRKFKGALVPQGLWIGGSSDPTPGVGWDTRVFPGVLAHAPSALRKLDSRPTLCAAPKSGAPKIVSQIDALGRRPSSSRPPERDATNSYSRTPLYQQRPASSYSNTIPATPAPPHQPKITPDVGSKPAANSIVPSGVLTPVEEKLEKASQLADQGALTEALGMLREVTRTAPLTPEAYLLLAQVQQSLGHPEAAVHELKRAIYLDPSNASAQLRLGFLLAEQGGAGAAIRAFRAATLLVSGIESPDPELIEIRRTAASQLVRLLREE